LLLTDAVRRPPRGDRHLSQEYLALLDRALGAEAPDSGIRAARLALPDLAPSPAARAAAAALLEREGVRAPYVVLGPGAVFGPAKRWPEERYAEVGRRLAARGHAVLVCGAASERETCERVAAAIGPAALPLAARTDLPVQTALCAGAALALCNDSGLAHVSAAAGAPTVVIFGSTSSAWTAPLGRRVRVLQDAPVCSPCFQRDCRIGFLCLTAVTVERVARACEEAA
jgi:heptosyltransferase-2